MSARKKPQRYWFKRKASDWWLVPITLEAWVVTFIYITGMVFIIWGLQLFFYPSFKLLLVMVGALALLTVVFAKAIKPVSEPLS